MYVGVGSPDNDERRDDVDVDDITKSVGVQAQTRWKPPIPRVEHESGDGTSV